MIAVNAKNAIGVFAALPLSAGMATIAQMTAMNIVALRGALDAVTFDQSCQPGMAWSRLKAYVIREAEVIPEPAQKICPMVEMIITILNAVSPSEDWKTAITM